MENHEEKIQVFQECLNRVILYRLYSQTNIVSLARFKKNSVISITVNDITLETDNPSKKTNVDSSID